MTAAERGTVERFITGVQYGDRRRPGAHREVHRVAGLEIGELRLTVLVDVAVRIDRVGLGGRAGLDRHALAADPADSAGLHRPEAAWASPVRSVPTGALSRCGVRRRSRGAGRW